MINLLLVDDHHVVRNGIKMLLEEQDDMRVVAEASNGKDALEILANDQSINLVLTDIDMEGISGISLTEQIQTLHPHVNVIILSMLKDYRHVCDCFRSGAKAYLVKNVDYRELLSAISHVAHGGKYMCEEMMISMIGSVYDEVPQQGYVNELIGNLELSDREMEVLHLIGEGFTNKEIADQLFLSKRTVEGHRQNLIDKTQVKNSAQLIKYAVEKRLI